MQIDIQGLDNILKYIEASKLSKFTIARLGNNNGITPLFECLDSDSNANAINEFKKIAEVLNNNCAYKIRLFDFAELIQNDSGEIKVKKSKNASNKMEVNFCINSLANFQPTHQQNTNNVSGAFDIGSLRSEIIKDIAKQQEDNAILNEIRELKSKFAEMEEEEEEEEENKGFSGIDQNQISQLMGLINLLKTNQNKATINGDDNSQLKRDNINKALKTLYKYDTELDKDLLKLSEIAETKTDTFNMLISTLRNM
tara:strand:+ start:6919 stop:7683 length:765 start_codon:yes stop_codon:yes gene_type:complete